ncbi:MAG: mechanosensitive ion channel family protein [archaeon]
MVLADYIANEWLRAFAVLLVLLLGIRIFLYLGQMILLRMTSRTKTDLDDKIVQKASSPLTILAFLIALRISLSQLFLHEIVYDLSVKIVNSMVVIVLFYLVFVFVDLVVITAVKKATKKTKSEVDDNLISLFHGVLKISLIVIAILYVLALWGVQITPLLAGLGIAGLAIALALQPILSNIFSGAAIVLDKTVRVGDLVYLDQNTKGRIDKVNLRSTRIVTFDNELIIVPNNKLADSMIQNVALPEPKSRVVVPFSVAYGSKIEKVKKVVLDEVKKIEHVERDPEPLVRFLEMGDSSLNFKAYFYVDSFENRFKAIDEANTKIYNALNKNKITIPFPQLDVHLKKK